VALLVGEESVEGMLFLSGRDRDLLEDPEVDVFLAAELENLRIGERLLVREVVRGEREYLEADVLVLLVE